MQQNQTLTGTIVGEVELVSLSQVSRVCRIREEWIVEFVDEGVVEPASRGPEGPRFDGPALQRLRVAARLRRDLGVNPAGVALALELMDEVQTLRRLLSSR
ncbi:MerR family transcriptional regulator [Verticiella sediminum]|uniref:MerR family transcriptional regulator n=1 Tax=Verticiella sediminum TaxID=1247510 RepID=A0A556ADV6_9BURK|nr:chaperone modulator CbpM [Verticiella sediminum]TSH91070.1 MerR family transcriptional regulator [Verticiella sediminum]